MSTSSDGLSDPLSDDLDSELVGESDWVRSEFDLARLAGWVLMLLTWFWFTGISRFTAGRLDRDLMSIGTLMPHWLRLLLLGVSQLTSVVLLALLVVGVRRHHRLLPVVMAAFALGTVAQLFSHGVVLDALAKGLTHPPAPTWMGGAQFPAAWTLAGLTAAVVTAGVVVPRPMFHLMVSFIVAIGIERALNLAMTPLAVIATIVIGGISGALLVVLFGSPRLLTNARILRAGLLAAGFPVTSLQDDERQPRAMTFKADSPRGKLYIKLLDREERNSAALQRLYWRIRTKGLVDDRWGWDQPKIVDEEALVALQAAAAGVQVSPVLAAGRTSNGDGLLIFDWAESPSLVSMPREEITDELMRSAFVQVERLHLAGIAHRWCLPRHFFLEPDGSVRLSNFQRAVRGADRMQRNTDVAQLIVGLSALTSPKRAVAAAKEVLGTDELARALPLVQPLALPPETAEPATRKELLADVRDELQAACGGLNYTLAPIERISLARVLGVVGGGVVLYVLLGFVTNWDQISQAARTMAWPALVLLVVLAATPYLTGALSLSATVPEGLPLGQAIRVMMAQSFLNRFTPAGTGGAALQLRYLQLRGQTTGAAAASIGVRAGMAGLAQVIVLLVFVAWSGSAGGVRLILPDADRTAVIITVLAVAAGVIWLTPWGRRVIARRVHGTLRQMWTAVRQLAGRPTALAVLVGTTLLGNVTTVAAYFVACRGVGINLPFETLGLLYLGGTMVASAAPTPGGVGAVEAALIASLTSMNVAASTAMAAVMVFRLITFWLPVPFCWLAFWRLRGTLEARDGD